MFLTGIDNYGYQQLDNNPVSYSTFPVYIEMVGMPTCSQKLLPIAISDIVIFFCDPLFPWTNKWKTSFGTSTEVTDPALTMSLQFHHVPVPPACWAFILHPSKTVGHSKSLWRRGSTTPFKLPCIVDLKPCQHVNHLYPVLQACDRLLAQAGMGRGERREHWRREKSHQEQIFTYLCKGRRRKWLAPYGTLQ